MGILWTLPLNFLPLRHALVSCFSRKISELSKCPCQLEDQKKIMLTHSPYFLLLVRLSWKGRKFTLLWMYATSCKKRELFSKRVNVGMESNKFLFLCHFKSSQRFNFWASESQLESCFCRYAYAETEMAGFIFMLFE